MPLDRQKVRQRVIEIIEENVSERGIYNKASKKLGDGIYNAKLLDIGLDTLDSDNAICYIQKEYGLNIVEEKYDSLDAINKLVNYVLKHARMTKAAR